MADRSTWSTASPLPASDDTERAVLGALLLRPEMIRTIVIRVDDFHHDRNRRIYEALLELDLEGNRIDILTVQVALERAGHLEEVGGIAYLAELDIHLPGLDGLEHYAATLRELRVRRELIAASDALRRRCLADTLPMTALEEHLACLTKISAEEPERAEGTGLGATMLEVARSYSEPRLSGLLGLPTGLAWLDQVTGGLQPGLTVIAGRPSMGKSTIALGIASHLALKRKVPVVFFSAEMRREQLATWALSRVTQIPYEPLQRGYGTTEQKELLLAAANRHVGDPLRVFDMAAPRVAQVCGIVRSLVAREQCRAVFFDHLGFLHPDRPVENRAWEVGTMVRALRDLGKDMGVPVILLCQLNRKPESRGSDHYPRLSDLRESGDIEQDADLVIFVHRPAYYERSATALRDRALLVVAKNRMGRTGESTLADGTPGFRWKPQTSSIEWIDDDR